MVSTSHGQSPPQGSRSDSDDSDSPPQSVRGESVPHGLRPGGPEGGPSASELLLNEVAQLSADYDVVRRRHVTDAAQRARLLQFSSHARPASPFARESASPAPGHRPVARDLAPPPPGEGLLSGAGTPPPHQMSSSQVSRIQKYRTPPALAAMIQPVPQTQPEPGPPLQPQPQSPPPALRERDAQTPPPPPPPRKESPSPANERHGAVPESAHSPVHSPASTSEATLVSAAPVSTTPRAVTPVSTTVSTAASSPAPDPAKAPATTSEVDRLMLIVREKQGSPAVDAQPRKNAQGQWRYKCFFEGCEKQFKQKAHLQTHVRSHTGERPFVCPFTHCGKHFSQQCNLRAHVRAHTGERPYKCHVCGKAFSQQGNMRNHTLIHFNDHPMVCQLDGCSRTFNQLGNLKAHQNAAHKETVHAFSLKLEAGTSVDDMDPKEQELFRHFCQLYKNANKGVRGRGKGTKSIIGRSEEHSTAASSPYESSPPLKRQPSSPPLHSPEAPQSETPAPPAPSAVPTTAPEEALVAPQQQAQQSEPLSPEFVVQHPADDSVPPKQLGDPTGPKKPKRRSRQVERTPCSLLLSQQTPPPQALPPEHALFQTSPQSWLQPQLQQTTPQPAQPHAQQPQQADSYHQPHPPSQQLMPPAQLAAPWQAYGGQQYEPFQLMQQVQSMQPAQPVQAPAKWPPYIQNAWDRVQVPSEQYGSPAPVVLPDASTLQYAVPPPQMQSVMPYMFQNGA